MKITICDICGEEAITVKDAKIAVVKTVIGRKPQSWQLDLCRDCFLKLSKLAEKGD